MGSGEGGAIRGQVGRAAARRGQRRWVRACRAAGDARAPGISHATCRRAGRRTARALDSSAALIVMEMRTLAEATDTVTAERGTAAAAATASAMPVRLAAS